MDVRCKHCRSLNHKREGFRKTQKRGKIQKYLCLDCERYFTNDDGFYRMRNTPAMITKAIDLYFSSLSSRKVRNQYKRHEDLKISHESILAWCRRYSIKTQKYIDSLNPQLGGRCYADDTLINCAGEKHHFWVSVDWDTRYINATHYSVDSGEIEAAKFIKKTKKQLPKYIQTDAAMFYPRAFRKVFYNNAIRGLSVEHRINNTLRTGKHNVRIETVFSKIKDRVRNFRGLKALWSAPLLLNGLIIHYNFVEEHTTTKLIPAILAKISNVENNNLWLTIIRQSIG